MYLGMDLEVAGCPTLCKHCWALGTPYGSMSFDDIRWVLEQSRRFCTDNGLEFGSFPFHEVAAHPRAPEVLQFYRDLFQGDPGFEPLATTGVPIALREDWEPFLQAIGATGTSTFWVAFHGFGADHDRLVQRKGAFEETCLAVRRIRSLGLRCGANIFLTKGVLRQFDALTETLLGLGLEEMSWELPRFLPTARSRQYEAHRPERADVLPVLDRIVALTGFWKEMWADLESYTEARWMQKALAEEWPSDTEAAEPLNIVCRSNFDIYTGRAGMYGTRHGNLKQDGVDATLRKAVVRGGCSDTRLYLRRDSFPPVEELARQWGEPEGQALHFFAPSIRYRWLDRFVRSSARQIAQSP